MAEENQENEKSIRAKRATKRVLPAAVIVLFIVLIGCFLWATDTLRFRSADKQLAAIEAARAIPDSENAAIIYNQLLEDYGQGQFTPDFLDPNTEYLTRTEPWSRDDYPELADWLKKQQVTIARLLEASKFEKCCFPINTDLEGYGDNIKRLAPIRQGAFLLIRAANNDIAQGKTDLGLEKYLCVIQIGKHECQQPLAIDHLIGIYIEAAALRAIARFIVEGSLSEPVLSRIEAIQLRTKERWADESESMLEVESLMHEKWCRQLGPVVRMTMWWVNRSARRDMVEGTRRQYLRLLADRRGNRILIALRRYKNKNGTWPKNLEDIKALVPDEIFVDPINNNSFVYKPTDDSFTLYSKGKNSIDEDGKRDKLGEEKTGADDWLIWPPKGRKNKEKDTNAKQ